MSYRTYSDEVLENAKELILKHIGLNLVLCATVPYQIFWLSIPRPLEGCGDYKCPELAAALEEWDVRVESVSQGIVPREYQGRGTLYALRIISLAVQPYCAVQYCRNEAEVHDTICSFHQDN